MTLNEFTTQIAGRFDKQFDMQYRQWLVPHINTWRSRLIRNSLQKNPTEKGQFLQTIQIPLTYGNYNCGGFECMGSYSKELPKLLRFGSTPFEYLGGIDSQSPYRYNDMGTSGYINEGKTARHFLSYEIRNNLVILPKARVELVMGSGIFDEPEKALEWQCKQGQGGCDWWNAEYPVTNDIAAMIRDGLWEQLDERGNLEESPKNQDQHV